LNKRYLSLFPRIAEISVTPSESDKSRYVNFPGYSDAIILRVENKERPNFAGLLLLLPVYARYKIGEFANNRRDLLLQQYQPSIEAILSHGYRDRLRDSTIREQGICLSPGINSLQEAAAERAGSETTVWLARSELNSEIR